MDCAVFAEDAKNTTFFPSASAAFAGSHFSQTTTSAGGLRRDVRRVNPNIPVVGELRPWQRHRHGQLGRRGGFRQRRADRAQRRQLAGRRVHRRQFARRHFAALLVLDRPHRLRARDVGGAVVRQVRRRFERLVHRVGPLRHPQQRHRRPAEPAERCRRDEALRVPERIERPDQRRALGRVIVQVEQRKAGVARACAAALRSPPCRAARRSGRRPARTAGRGRAGVSFPGRRGSARSSSPPSRRVYFFISLKSGKNIHWPISWPMMGRASLATTLAQVPLRARARGCRGRRPARSTGGWRWSAPQDADE